MYYSIFAHYLPKTRSSYSKVAQHLTRMLDTPISQFVWNIWYLLYSENVIGLIFQNFANNKTPKIQLLRNCSKKYKYFGIWIFHHFSLDKNPHYNNYFLMFNFSRHYFKLELKAKVRQSLLKNCSIKEHYTDVVIF